MFKLTFETGNAAFGEDEGDNLGRAAEVARILRKIADDAEAGCVASAVYDVNGNRVGAWSLTR